MGIEPTSSAWKAEVLPLNYTRADGALCRLHLTVARLPFLWWWRGKDSNLRRRKPADLQSAPVGRLGTPPQNEPRILILRWRGVNAFLARILLAGRADSVPEGVLTPFPRGSVRPPGPPHVAARVSPGPPGGCYPGAG